MPDKSERLKSLDSSKLVDLVRNYRQYGYDEDFRKEALGILEERGIDKEQLQLTGSFDNHNYDRAQELYTDFRKNSNRAFILYAILFVTLIGLGMIRSIVEIPVLLHMLIVWGVIASYWVFLIKSFLNQDSFYKIAGRNYGSEGILLYLLLGMPLYIIMFFYFKKQMAEQMRLIQ